MATVVLGAAGAAIGFVVGGPAGAIQGAQIGASIGSVIDQQIIFAPGETNVQTGRIEDLRVQVSREGMAIPRTYGRVRIAGQIIWATEFREEATTSDAGGGKGGGGGTTVTEYSYYANFAIGLCEGEISGIGKVWADGTALEIDGYTARLYTGTEDQSPDSFIESVEGAGKAPAYRGLAYIVFEGLPLARFGNRVPQLNFEVFRSVGTGELEDQVTAVTLAPSAGEFGLGTQVVNRDDGNGQGDLENMSSGQGIANMLVSAHRLKDDLPNVESVSLHVGWTGNDMRCGQIALKPAVESSYSNTDPYVWTSNGVARSDAYLLSSDDTGVVLQGTPADQAVVEAIVELKARGLRVVFSPAVQLDIPSGNALDNPYSPGSSQPINPWRGRITCDPAPGVTATVDKTAAASAQVDSFFGTAATTDFDVTGTDVSWTGGTDWGYRRMVLHYAKLCAAAGGVDTFLIGSQMGGMTRIRSSASTYPAVAKLKALAADVSTILGASTQVSYAANWGEYHSYTPADGSGDIDFHLDDLWSDANIDFVAIDNYIPISDWRNGTSHLDAGAGWGDGYDIDYLKSNIDGGEEFDWYYASMADRDSQTRTSITDATYSEPWVFRVKDIKSWWQNAHHARPGGIRNAGATSWVAQSKPVWFTELGCPAVDKGANRPGLVFDVLSDESALPHYSTGARDDRIQRNFLLAHLSHWAEVSNNPISSVYSAPMVDTPNIHISEWDPRPYPEYPRRVAGWRDTANWRTGRSLTGRVGGTGLGSLVSSLCGEVGFNNIDTFGLRGTVPGYVLDQLLSPRAAIQPLMLAYQFDVTESEGTIKFFHRDQAVAGSIGAAELVESGDDLPDRFKLTRGQETELPLVAKLTYLEDGADYMPATAEFRRQTVATDRVAQTEVPIVIDPDDAQGIADIWLMEIWAMRERLEAHLAPSDIRFDPGDIVTFHLNNRDHTMRLSEVNDTYARLIRALGTEQGVYSSPAIANIGGQLPSVPIYRPPDIIFLDLPLLSGRERPEAPHMAANVVPWPGSLAVYRSPTTSDFGLDTNIKAPATIGTTLEAFGEGPVGRFDHANSLSVRIGYGELASLPTEQVLSGGNLAAVQNTSGDWEMVQFQTATLTDTNTYELTDLLRGQFGTETAMEASLAPGARFVLMNEAVVQSSLTLNERQLPQTWRYGPAPVPINHRSFKTEELSFQGIGLRPYTVGQMWGSRSGGNAVNLTWARRSRMGGDEWEKDDIPLGEAFEEYYLEVLNGVGGSVVRDQTVNEANWTYSSTFQFLDFGSYPDTLSVRITQISDTWGAGVPREFIINVKQQ